MSADAHKFAAVVIQVPCAYYACSDAQKGNTCLGHLRCSNRIQVQQQRVGRCINTSLGDRQAVLPKHTTMAEFDKGRPDSWTAITSFSSIVSCVHGKQCYL